MNCETPFVWRTIEGNPADVEALAGSWDLPRALAGVLAVRMAVGIEDIGRFLNPRLDDLGDPLVLPGMRVAAARVCQAIKDREMILLHGDYDVDGIASVGLLSRVLGELGAFVQPWLPNRMRDGYGFTPESLVRGLRERPRPSLIITADCGTNSVEAVRLAAREGIEVVVTDHHEPCGPLAPAVAVVNPKLGTDPALRALAGVGVAFKLCHAVLTLGREQGLDRTQSVDLGRYLDWVALGTVADIVPLLGENRIMVRHGLARLNEAPSTGVAALMEVADLHGPLDAFHISVMLGPRLNAVGRLGAPDRALELLMTEDLSRARYLAGALDAANRERQDLETRIGNEAREDLEAAFQLGRSFGLAVGRLGWHRGVVGNVASRLAARFRRPVAVVAFDPDGRGKGSCRGVEGFSLLKALESCADCLDSFGGHEGAAGIEVRQDRFELFCEHFNQAAASALIGVDLTPVLTISGWLDLAETAPDFMDALDRLRPFGPDNPEPIWAVRGVEAVHPRKVGRNHLRVELRAGGVRRQAIAFDRAERALPHGLWDVAFRLRRAPYAGEGALQLHVIDIRSTQP